MEILEKVKNLQEKDQNRGALRLIYNTLEDALISENYEYVNDVLSNIQVSDFNLTILIGFLSSTFMWKENLSARNSLYNVVKIKAVSSEKDKKFMSIYDGLK